MIVDANANSKKYFINKKAFISRTLISAGGVCFFINNLKRLYPQYTYEMASIYVLAIGAVIASIIGAVRLKRKTELLWGLLLVGWGLIMSIYTSYQGIILACVKIGPLLGYCLWEIYRSEQCKTTSDKGSIVSYQQDQAGQGLSKYTRYNKLLVRSYLIAGPTLVISIVYFALLNPKIPIVQRGEALKWSIILFLAVGIFYLGFMIYAYLFKKVHDFMIWILVVVSMSVYLVPAIVGFGWEYVLAGIPWGVGAFYTGKADQEKWKARRCNTSLSP